MKGLFTAEKLRYALRWAVPCVLLADIIDLTVFWFVAPERLLFEFIVTTGIASVVAFPVCLLLAHLNVDLREAKERALSAEREMAKARTAAEDASRAKAEFLATMSHEIRTPMNGVMAVTDMLATTQLTERQRTYTDVIARSGDALLAIINDILDFSKIEAGKLEFDDAPFDLGEAAEDVAVLVATRIGERPVELVVDIDPTLPARLSGDVGRVRQVLTNLAGNAVKFTDEGEVAIRVTWRETLRSGKPHAVISIQVSDTGMGIPEDQVARIFETFAQTTHKREGSGLGLPIARSLVEHMGGEITCRSRQGAGSQFHVSLVLPIVERSPRAALLPQTGVNRVLVACPHEGLCDSLVRSLAALGVQSAGVVSVRELDQFLRVARETAMKVDAVMLDSRLQGDTPDAHPLSQLRRAEAEGEIDVTRIILARTRDTVEPEPDEYMLGLPMRLEQLSSVLSRVDAARKPTPVWSASNRA